MGFTAQVHEISIEHGGETRVFRVKELSGRQVLKLNDFKEQGKSNTDFLARCLSDALVNADGKPLSKAEVDEIIDFPKSACDAVCGAVLEKCGLKDKKEPEKKD